jgi:gamma-glutamylaminecyclotransferase
MQKVFVFGTLKEGFPNFTMNKGVRYGSVFQTKCSFPLYLIGERSSPWLVLEHGKGFPVIGQVFEVDDDALASMDVLERIHEPDGYRRIVTTVVCTISREELSVFVYGKPPEMLNVEEVQSELMGEYLPKHADMYRNRAS